MVNGTVLHMSFLLPQSPDRNSLLLLLTLLWNFILLFGTIFYSGMMFMLLAVPTHTHTFTLLTAPRGQGLFSFPSTGLEEAGGWQEFLFLYSLLDMRPLHVVCFQRCLISELPAGLVYIPTNARQKQPLSNFCYESKKIKPLPNCEKLGVAWVKKRKGYRKGTSCYGCEVQFLYCIHGKHSNYQKIMLWHFLLLNYRKVAALRCFKGSEDSYHTEHLAFLSSEHVPQNVTNKPGFSVLYSKAQFRSGGTQTAKPATL